MHKRKFSLLIESGVVVDTTMPNSINAVTFRKYSLSNPLQFFEDGKMLASGGYDKIVRIWDVARGEEIKRLKATWPPSARSRFRAMGNSSPRRVATAACGSGTSPTAG